MSSRGQGVDRAGLLRTVRPVVISILIGVGFCGVTLLLLSLLMTVQSVPQSAVDPMAGLALVVGGFFAGFSCAKMTGGKGLVYGAVCGLLMTLILYLAGFVLKDNSFGIPALLKAAFLILSAMLGGVLGVNSKRRRRR